MGKDLKDRLARDEVYVVACRVLRDRGIDPLAADYDVFSDALDIAAEAVEAGRDASVVQVTRGAVVAGDRSDTNAQVLARFAANGQFVSELGIDEEAFLAEAIAQEQRRDALGVAAYAGGGLSLGDSAYCDGCGYHLVDVGCQCGKG